MGRGPSLALEYSGAKPFVPARLLHISAWDTSAHRHISEDEWTSSPPHKHHPQSPTNSSQCKYGLWFPKGQQGEPCPHVCSPYLTPVLNQSGLQLQGQLQEPVLHLDKTVVTDRLGLCSQHCQQARTIPCTLENGEEGSDYYGHRLSLSVPYLDYSWRIQRW